MQITLLSVLYYNRRQSSHTIIVQVLNLIHWQIKLQGTLYRSPIYRVDNVIQCMGTLIPVRDVDKNNKTKIRRKR